MCYILFSIILGFELFNSIGGGLLSKRRFFYGKILFFAIFMVQFYLNVMELLNDVQREFLKISARDELHRLAERSEADKIEFSITEFGTTFNVTAIKGAQDQWSVVRILRDTINTD